MIDLHSHILPGIDDGAHSLDECLEMARLYTASGFRQVVATPHAVTDSLGQNLARSITRQVPKLNAILREKEIDLVLKTGMEIALTPEVPDFLDRGLLLTLAGSRYALIEPPFENLPINWEQFFFSIISRGYRILLAHPERCAQLARKPELFDRLIETGVYLQVTWGSFLGLHGRPALQTARYLAQRGFIHCLATDSHDTRQRNAAPVPEAASKVAELIGPANLDRLSTENPARVIGDVPLETMDMRLMPSQPARRHQRWKFWKRKAS
jgi:protein-tyrosine phosphatase